MTAKDIIIEWLRANGYDGLCCAEEECGCIIDDPCPRMSDPSLCKAGKKRLKDDGGWEIAE